MHHHHHIIIIIFISKIYKHNQAARKSQDYNTNIKLYNKQNTKKVAKQLLDRNSSTSV